MRISILPAVLALLASCSDPEPPKPKISSEEAREKNNDDLEWVRSRTGLEYADLIIGDGPYPKRGQTVAVHYRGWLNNGVQFDSSYEKGFPLEFQIGVKPLQVIPGWVEGVSSMKVGGMRRLKIPAALGYGSVERPGIPGGSVLNFDVELLEVR